MSSEDNLNKEKEELGNGITTEYTPQNNPSGKKPNSGRKGFYIALAVCLVAVGVAGWTTYDSVHHYRKTTADTVQTITSGVTSETPSASVFSSMVPTPSKSTAKSKSAAGAATSAVHRKKTVPAAAIVTKLQKPVKDAAVQCSFSETPIYSKTMHDWRAHTGMDLHAAKGAEVTAAADGIIKGVQKSDSMGVTVQISHNGGLTTLYCGLANVSVKKGETVSIGQKIGTVGTVPSEVSEDSHLHFAVQKDGAFVDPASYLQ